ncbi:IS66 family transposase [Hungatella effluvii]|nr:MULTISPECIES: transposase [Hungatella]
MNYCNKQKEALNVFLNDDKDPLDNNETEGVLRSVCLHKHA